MKSIYIGVLVIVIALVSYMVWQTSGAGPVTPGTGMPTGTPESIGQEAPQNPNSAEGAPEGSIHNLPVPPAVAAVRAKVAAEAGVATNQVLIESAFEREWSDGCLGLGGPAESCLMAIVPGWEVTVSAKGQTSVYRTNADGSVIRKESAN